MKSQTSKRENFFRIFIAFILTIAIAYLPGKEVQAYIDFTSFATKVDFGTGNSPYGIAIGDLDGDGKPDLAVTNYYSNSISVLRNTSTNGTISFAPQVVFNTGIHPAQIAIGDLDGDGKPDLAVAIGRYYNISVLRNTSTSGSISFATQVVFNVGNSPYSIGIGDLDGDSKPDLAVANVWSNNVSVLRNTSTSGSITFATQVVFGTGTNPYGIAIVDLDGDSKPDLAIPNSGSNNVSVLRNTSTSGMVSFATQVTFSTGTNSHNIAIDDLDGDSKLDLAVVNYGSNTVSVLQNTSTGGSTSFTPQMAFSTGTMPLGVAISDLDQDGKPDLAVTNYNSNTISVLQNNSTGGSVSFSPKVDFGTGTNPYNVAISDLDGDGKPDLAVTNFGGNTVSVLRNTLDTTAPIVIINSIFPNPTNSGTTITWYANENGTFSVQVGGTACDNGTVVTSGNYSTSPATVDTVITSDALSEGLNTLRVCVTDRAINIGSAISLVNKVIPIPVVQPSTGFAPERVTVLPVQPANKAFTAMGDLWLEIPKLDIKLNIVGVPLVKGEWDVSWLSNDVGWLDGSAYPTAVGNSALTGHVWNADNTAGSFRNINSLKWGDKIIIHAWGAQYIYEVRSVSKVRPENVNALLKHEEFSWVTLVTCSSYDTTSLSYEYRVLVRAVLVEVK